MTRKYRLTISLILSLVLVLTLSSCTTDSPERVKPNVLFMFFDDLNDWTGSGGGHSQAVTPNMDRVASQGVFFTNTLCPAPLCTPSRASMFVGLRPDQTGVYSNADHLKDTTSGLLSLPEHFRNNGYYTIKTGKTFTVGGDYAVAAWDLQGPAPGVKGPQGGPFTREEYHRDGKPDHYLVERLGVTRPLSGMVDKRTHNRGGSFDWGGFDLPDNAFEDGVVAEWAVEQLHKISSGQDKPFFMAVGFYRPHQPLYAPRRYFDLFPPEGIQLPQVRTDDLDDVPEVAKYYSLIAATAGLHTWVTEADQWNEAVAAYLACTSFADAQAGKVLDALEKAGLADDTIIVMAGDNGYHLGEKEHWGKFTAWQESSRVPLIISVPEKLRQAIPEATVFQPGSKADFAAELTDIFPTLSTLAGLPPVEGLDGNDLGKLANNPEYAAARISVTTFGRGNFVLARNNWRYIHYFDGSEELYNLESDPDQFTNLAGDDASAEMLEIMRGGVPEKPEIAWMARMEQYKLVRCEDGSSILLDLTDPRGVTDAGNIAPDNPEIVAKIEKLRQEKGITAKYCSVL